ncbi:MAG: hypothetical protein VXB01_14185, partial [Opitutae bacterium]
MKGRFDSLVFLLLAVVIYGDPVLYLDGDLPTVGFVSKGGVQSVDGATLPEYPGFSEGNKAI